MEYNKFELLKTRSNEPGLQEILANNNFFKKLGDTTKLLEFLIRRNNLIPRHVQLKFYYKKISASDYNKALQHDFILYISQTAFITLLSFFKTDIS